MHVFHMEILGIKEYITQFMLLMKFSYSNKSYTFFLLKYPQVHLIKDSCITVHQVLGLIKLA